MISLFWNCQGAASKAFKRTLKQFCRDHSPSLVCLLEPKVSGSHANKICKDLDFDEWIRVEAVGFSGGIWILWKDTLSISILNTHPQYVNLQVQEPNATPWLLSVVYGSPYASLRRKLFEDLSAQKFDPQTQWLICGDFNAVTCQQEVSNQSCFSLTRCLGFNDWISREGLIDLGFVGTRFTWMRGVNSDSFKGTRLDRALGNIEWKLRFPEARVEHLQMITSDHTPLLLNTNPAPRESGPKKFRFNLAWATHQGFQPLVRQNWNAATDLESNKAQMAKALTSWNNSTFGNIFHRKKRLLARLKGIQTSIAQQYRSDLIKLERKLRKELDDTLHQEELIWFQRSREDWLVSGDCNTRFYHIATTIKSSNTGVCKLRTDDGHWITDTKLLAVHVREYFIQLFAETPSMEVNGLPHGHFPSLNDMQQQWINSPFQEQEIKQALFEMDACKAPGPDGFNASFYQKSWAIVGKSLIDFALEFFRSGLLPSGCNDTVITLIPKVPNPKSVK